MSEETKVDVEYTEAETKAMENGWVPKEQWDANEDNAGKKWRDAEEFNDRGELFDKIKQLDRDAKSARKALEQLGEHHKKVKEVEFQRALNTLKVQKRQALEEGDADKLIEIDDKIADVKQSARQVINETVVNTPPPELDEFISRNKWYSKDDEMTQEADALGVAYARSHRDATPTEVFNYVEKRIKALYPEKFTNPNKPRASGVESPSNNTSVKSAARGGYTLTEQEERVARNLERSGAMTREQYIKELKEYDARKR